MHVRYRSSSSGPPCLPDVTACCSPLLFPRCCIPIAESRTARRRPSLIARLVLPGLLSLDEVSESLEKIEPAKA